MKHLLIFLSLAMWLVSLVLPAFLTERETWFGVNILLIGIPLGWLGAGLAGFAVYANIFYIYAWFKLLLGKNKPRVSIIMMLLLASLTVFLNEIMYDARPAYIELASWGWGAIIWGMSVLLLAYAVWLPEKYHKPRYALLPPIAFFSTIAIALNLLKYHQYQQANEDERKRYLPIWVAFSVHEFSGIIYKEPPKNLNITENTVFELEGNLAEGDENVHLQINKHADKPSYVYQLPTNFQYQEYFWRYIGAPRASRFTLYLLEPKQEPDYRYRVKLINETQFEHILTDARTEQILWSAPVNFNGTYHQYPDYNLHKFFEPKDKNKRYINKSTWKEETFNQACPYKPYTADPKISNAVEWQGKILKMVSNGQYAVSFDDYPHAYCSESYALLIKKWWHKNERLIFEAIMFDKQTLQMLEDDFNFVGENDKPPYLNPVVEKDALTYRRLTDNGTSLPEIHFTGIRLAHNVPQPCIYQRDKDKDCSRTALIVPTNRGDFEAQ